MFFTSSYSHRPSNLPRARPRHSGGGMMTAADEYLHCKFYRSQRFAKIPSSLQRRSSCPAPPKILLRLQTGTRHPSVSSSSSSSFPFPYSYSSFPVALVPGQMLAWVASCWVVHSCWSRAQGKGAHWPRKGRRLWRWPAREEGRAR